VGAAANVHRCRCHRRRRCFFSTTPPYTHPTIPPPPGAPHGSPRRCIGCCSLCLGSGSPCVPSSAPPPPWRAPAGPRRPTVGQAQAQAGPADQRDEPNGAEPSLRLLDCTPAPCHRRCTGEAPPNSATCAAWPHPPPPRAPSGTSLHPLPTAHPCRRRGDGRCHISMAPPPQHRPVRQWRGGGSSGFQSRGRTHISPCGQWGGREPAAPGGDFEDGAH